MTNMAVSHWKPILIGGDLTNIANSFLSTFLYFDSPQGLSLFGVIAPKYMYMVALEVQQRKKPLLHGICEDVFTCVLKK